jgi:hypothetical protein
MYPGDVNQDGVLNGTDVVLMLSELQKAPAERNQSQDLNYDQIVTGIDYSLMLNSMEVFDDE